MVPVVPWCLKIERHRRIVFGIMYSIANSCDCVRLSTHPRTTDPAPKCPLETKKVGRVKRTRTAEQKVRCLCSRSRVHDVDPVHGSSFQFTCAGRCEDSRLKLKRLRTLNNTGPHTTTIFTAFAYGSVAQARFWRVSHHLFTSPRHLPRACVTRLAAARCDALKSETVSVTRRLSHMSATLSCDRCERSYPDVYVK